MHATRYGENKLRASASDSEASRFDSAGPVRVTSSCSLDFHRSVRIIPPDDSEILCETGSVLTVNVRRLSRVAGSWLTTESPGVGRSFIRILR